MRRRTFETLSGCLAWIAVTIAIQGGLSAAEYVLIISIDGCRPAEVERLLSQGELKHFARIRDEGVWTHNARTDFASTFTNPNHVSMVTGRPVLGPDGHLYQSNAIPAPDTTLHINPGFYIASIFDVAHDRGLTTAMHRSKTKLAMIDQSYSDTFGAEDTTGDDNGRAKIDIIRFNETNRRATLLMNLVEADLLMQPVNLGFIHLSDPDRAGHGFMWSSMAYHDALRRVDDYLGRILHLVENNEPYAGRTTIIVSSDHGGGSPEGDHDDAAHPENYRIPFYVWGADVPVTGDLYQLNAASRVDPQTGRPDFAAAGQPIRNGDMGNLALDLLGLPSIPGSTINAGQDLEVAAQPSDGVPKLAIRRLPKGQIQLRWTPNISGRLQVSDRLDVWADVPGDWPRPERYWLEPDPTTGSKFYRFLSPAVE